MAIIILILKKWIKLSNNAILSIYTVHGSTLTKNTIIRHTNLKSC